MIRLTQHSHRYTTCSACRETVRSSATIQVGDMETFSLCLSCLRQLAVQIRQAERRAEKEQVKA